MPLESEVEMDESVTAVFERARASYGEARKGVFAGELLTPDELAGRLKVTVGWIYEKRRPRCANPLPAIPMGRTIRFDWDSVVAWLGAQAAADAKNLQSKGNGRIARKTAKRTKR
jgi:hypothetical protein